MYAIFFFVFICIFITQLCIILQMEFLAICFIIIYLGSLCVLIIFQVKLLKTLTEKNKLIYLNDKLLSSCILIFLLIIIIQICTAYYFGDNTNVLTNFSNINLISLQQLNYNLWVNYLFNFHNLHAIGLYLYYYQPTYLLYGSLVLITGMIGCIVLTLEYSEKFKYRV